MANRTIEEAHELLDKFHNCDSVGSLTFHKSPNKDYVVQHNGTIKLRELPEEERNFFIRFMFDWNAIKIEADAPGGVADRVRIIRTFE